MQDLLEDFLGDCRRRPLSEVTCAGYRQIGTGWLKWFAGTYHRAPGIEDWTRQTAEAYLAESVRLRLKQTTRRGNVAALRSWGNWLVSQCHASKNPWAGLKTPVNEELRQPCPTHEQVRALFDACDRMRNPVRGAMAKATLTLLALAGLRLSEMLAVCVSDVQIDAPPRRVRVPWGKGGKAGSVRLNAYACECLAAWLAIRPETPIPNLIYLHGNQRQDRAYTTDAFASLLANLKHLAKLDDVDITAHALRRFAATSLAQQPGATIADVQAFLRHSDPSVSLRYIKGNLSKQGEFVEGILPRPVQPSPTVVVTPVDNRAQSHAGKRRSAWRRA